MNKLPKLITTVDEFSHLNREDEERFRKQLVDLFETFDTFWKCNKKYGFRISHNQETDTLIVLRSRECVACGVEVFSPNLTTRNEISKEMLKTNTVLCETCAAPLEKMVEGKPK